MNRLVLVVFLALGSIAAFGQEKPAGQQDNPNQAEKNIAEEAREKEKAQNNLWQLEKIAYDRRKSEEFLDLYNQYASQRDKELVPKLKRALEDGDEDLIEVALDKIDANMGNLYLNGKFAVEEYGKRFWSEAGTAYRQDLITEEQYSEHLKVYRKTKARTEEPVPSPLAAMIAEAKKKVPAYFVRREALGLAFWPQTRLAQTLEAGRVTLPCHPF